MAPKVEDCVALPPETPTLTPLSDREFADETPSSAASIPSKTWSPVAPAALDAKPISDAKSKVCNWLSAGELLVLLLTEI